MLLQSRNFDNGQISRYRQLQRQLYDILEEISETLKLGETELEVAGRIRRRLRALEVRSWFHVPVVLFGDRTAYPGDFGQFEARPTGRRLEEGDAVILDAAPIIDGYLIDCSLAIPRGDGDAAGFARCDVLLAELRELIRLRAAEGANMQQTAKEVDRIIVDRGFENCHKKHIGEVLAHRSAITRGRPLWRRRIWGLSPVPVGWFFWKSYRSRKGDPAQTPNWNHRRQSDTAMQHGLWCVEPHVGLGATGVKFEELLLVNEEGARYVDDDLPHVRRWRTRSSSPVI